jgi:integrase
METERTEAMTAALQEAPTSRRGLTSDTLDEWAAHMALNSYSPATMRAYLATGRSVLAWLETDSDEGWLNNYFNARRKQISASSLNAARAAVRHLFRFIGEETPLVGYRMPPVTFHGPHPLPGGMADVERMIEAAEGARDKVLVVAMCGFAGLRISEALAAKPRDFNFKQRILTVKGKGEKVRYVTITDKLISAVASVAATLFADAPDVPMVKYVDSSAREAMTNVAKAAGISRGVSSHDLRMTYATHLYKRTHDILLVQTQLGHTDIKTTQLYVQLDPNDTREAIQAAFMEDE